MIVSDPKAMAKRKAITIGSDCSGVGTDAIALSRLGVRFENLFASDSDPHCRAVLECILDINNQTHVTFIHDNPNTPVSDSQRIT